MHSEVKVLHVTPVFFPAFEDGGPVVAFYELCQKLAQLGCEVRVLTTDAHGWDKSLDVEIRHEIGLGRNFRVRYCKRIMRRSISPTLLRLLPGYIKWADVVHLSSAYNFPTIPTLAFCRMLGKPVIWTPHGGLQRWRESRRPIVKSIWEAICRLVSPAGLMLHSTSQQEAMASCERFPEAGSIVIPYCIPIPEQVEHAQKADVVRLLYLGRLDPKKGIENLVEACRLLKEQSLLAWSLTIAGSGDPGYTERLRMRIRASGLPLHDIAPQSISTTKHESGHAYMVGNVTGEQKIHVFQHADFLVVPSHTENFGVVVAEALAHEVPVIASTGTPWNRLEEVGCGFWVNNDPASLAQAIQRMSGAALREMGRLGRKWSGEAFSGEKVGQDTLACYERVFGPNPYQSGEPWCVR